jgi:hypothetical protein
MRGWLEGLNKGDAEALDWVTGKCADATIQ